VPTLMLASESQMLPHGLVSKQILRSSSKVGLGYEAKILDKLSIVSS
jgi:hypothetical protein